MHSYAADFYGQEMKVVALGYIRYRLEALQCPLRQQTLGMQLCFQGFTGVAHQRGSSCPLA